MWICKSCGEITEDDAWESCWKCNTVRPDVSTEIPDETTESKADVENPPIDSESETTVAPDQAPAPDDDQPVITLRDVLTNTPEEGRRGYEDAFEKDRLARFITCIRCGESLRYLGSKTFQNQGGLPPWLSDLGEDITGNTDLDQYFCPKCGNVELFVNGIG